MKERPVLESIIAEIHRRADKEWAREGHDFAVWITADEYKALCEEEIMVAQEEVGEGVPDYINDAIDNLAHDNYRMDYAGYLERKKDIALIRAYIARSELYLNGGSNYRADAERAEEIINDALAGGKHEPKER